jgi:hypothetical protein
MPPCQVQLEAAAHRSKRPRDGYASWGPVLTWNNITWH